MNNKIDRRQFVQSTAALGAGLFVAPGILSSTASAAAKDDINVAIIGAGSEGTVLRDSITKLGRKSGIKIKAVCDIWDFNKDEFASTLKKYKRYYGYDDRKYTDYKEMLDAEKGKIDAVIVATPDCFHAEHTIACLEAGMHVYCEKEMSNTIEGAKSMVAAAKKAQKEKGLLLQIGHQRRSNPKYIFAKKNIIDKQLKLRREKLSAVADKSDLYESIDSTLLGRITTINGQWNRGAKHCRPLGWPKGKEIKDEILQKYGFENMQQFRNWRLYKKFGGGPIVDLGSHQIDIYSWFLDEALPTSVTASGGVDYWTKDSEWYDNVMAIFEFASKEGPVRAFYQTLTTSGSGGYFEKFMGVNGTLEISEDPQVFQVGRQPKLLKIESDRNEPDGWASWVKEGIIKPVPKPEIDHSKDTSAADVRSSPPLKPYYIKLDYDPNGFDAKMKPHAYHLVNFFDAIRDKKVKLNCPAEIGYHTAVMVHKVNEAVAARKTLELKPEDFHV